VTVQKGEGDHTWIETYAVEREDWDKMMELENNWKREVKETPVIKTISTDEEEVTPTVNDFETNVEDENEESFMSELDEYKITDDTDDESNNDIEE
jgi:hypothetical protein